MSDLYVLIAIFNYFAFVFNSNPPAYVNSAALLIDS